MNGIWEKRVEGVAVVTIYDSGESGRIIGRYMIVKNRKDVTRKTGVRTTISYRHQLPAAKRMAEKFLARYEDSPAGSSKQQSHQEQPSESKNSADNQGDQEKNGVDLECQADHRSEGQADVGDNRAVVFDDGRGTSLRVDNAGRLALCVDGSGVLVSGHAASRANRAVVGQAGKAARAYGAYQKFASRDFLLTLTYVGVRMGKAVRL